MNTHVVLPLPARLFANHHPPAPIDVGTAWGLERGGFIGILGCPPTTDLVGHLRNVEGVLTKVQEALPTNSSVFYRRVWTTDVPISIDQACKDWVPKNRNAPLLGYVVDVPETFGGSEILHVIDRLMPVILNIGASRSALIFSCRGSHPTAMSYRVGQFLDILGSRCKQPVDALVLRTCAADWPFPSQAGLKSRFAPQACHFLGWLESLDERMSAYTSVSQHLSPSWLATIVDACPEGTQAQKPFDSSKVLQYVYSNSSWPKHFTEKLLKITAEWMPEWLLPMFEACFLENSSEQMYAALNVVFDNIDRLDIEDLWFHLWLPEAEKKLKTYDSDDLFCFFTDNFGSKFQKLICVLMRLEFQDKSDISSQILTELSKTNAINLLKFRNILKNIQERC